jgi:guanylate kinase
MSSLRLITKFEDALRDYHYSDAAKQILAATKLILLVGATASGRNTAIRELLKTDRYHFIISDTTRKPRENNGVLERNGVEYFFRSEEEMLEEIENGEFLEAEIIHGRQVSGISMRELEKANQEAKIAITDIDIGGIQNVLVLKPDTVAILMLPPDFETWQQRISGRGEMAPEVYKSRLETAARIFESAQASTALHFVVNSDVATAAQQIDDLANGKPKDEPSEQAAHFLLEDLLAATRKRLTELN